MIKYRSLKGYKYQLTKRYCITIPIKPLSKITAPFLRLGKTGRLQILKGYAWDGASGPTWDRPRKHIMRGSLVHDACYQLIEEEWLHLGLHAENRLIADKLLRQILLEDGMGRFRAWYYYKAVRWFGGKYCEPKRKEVNDG